jgi:hypothetical protein
MYEVCFIVFANITINTNDDRPYRSSLLLRLLDLQISALCQT